MSSCTGHCCRSFFLGLPQLGLLTDPDPESPGQDSEKILDMIIWVQWCEDNKGEFSGGKFTCKHLDTETGRCNNYENRPQMCVDYPYGSKCSFKECTMDAEEQLGTNKLKKPCTANGS